MLELRALVQAVGRHQNRSGEVIEAIALTIAVDVMIAVEIADAAPRAARQRECFMRRKQTAERFTAGEVAAEDEEAASSARDENIAHCVAVDVAGR